MDTADSEDRTRTGSWSRGTASPDPNGSRRATAADRAVADESKLEISRRRSGSGTALGTARDTVAESDATRTPKTKLATGESRHRRTAGQLLTARQAPMDAQPAHAQADKLDSNTEQVRDEAEQYLIEYIRDLVGHAPPLSDEQRRRLSRILRFDVRRSADRGPG